MMGNMYMNVFGADLSSQRFWKLVKADDLANELDDRYRSQPSFVSPIHGRGQRLTKL